jgi:hypothetical protein
MDTMFKKISLTGMLLALGMIWSSSLYAQQGKISGVVTDAETGETLPGVNVIIDGTQKGTATNVDGYYTLLNMQPGTYVLNFTYIGYQPVTVQDVRVDVGNTTEISVEMGSEVIEGEEVVIRAERPIVQVDISSNQANLSSEEIENLPVQSIDEVVGLQAGVRGLSIRGGGSDEISFNVNGLNMRDERDNTPITDISYTSIQNIQVQTGGFNAEYGNIRSGLINVTTKEGSADRFSVDAMVRYTPPQDKNQGMAVNNPNSYWIRPYVDPGVAWSGTESGAWDPFTQNQYPEFGGWVAVSEQLLADDNPDNDLTPEAAQKVFLWQHRKEFEIIEPDYDIDLSVGGPVIGLSDMLGNLRFNYSTRQQQEIYFIPLSRDRYMSSSHMLKVTSDLRPGMKLSMEGMYGLSKGTNNQRTGQPGMFTSAGSIASQMDRISFIESRIFSTDYWAPSKREYITLGATFTHTISDRTYYEIRLNNTSTFYETNPGPRRNTDGVYSPVPGISFNEAPFGYFEAPSDGIGSSMRMGVGMSNARDSSEVYATNLKFDITSQMNRFNQVKAGVEFNVTKSKVNYGTVDRFLPSGRTRSKWNTTPLRFSAYVQDKLEFEGLIANLGLRADMSDPNVDWYDYENYDAAFEQGMYPGLDTLLSKSNADFQFTLSPRLGISFPITVTSKLFFNYGHFYSMPSPESLYLERYEPNTNTINRIANPNAPLPKTVAYELGYEQGFFDQYLLRLSGYYRDVAQQSLLVNYVGRNSKTDYLVSKPRSYEDIRGFEATLRRQRGTWFRGELNYTYSISSSGRFGFATQYQNPAQQTNYEQITTANNQSKPVPRPYARLNLDFMTPLDLGPEWGFFKPLADWRMSFITSWTKGYAVTWAGGGGSVPGIENNLRYTDSWNTNLRLTKNVSLPGNSRLQLFMDLNNVLNQRNLTTYGYVDGIDYIEYMRSLHLPGRKLEQLEGSYLSVPGSDQPGDYREPGVAFHPIVSTTSLSSVDNPSERPLYYDYNEGEYYQYQNGEFVAADDKLVNKVLKDKAYIDMPNQTFFNFLNPRTIRFGFRISF